MSIMTFGIYLARNVFAVHGVDENGITAKCDCLEQGIYRCMPWNPHGHWLAERVVVDAGIHCPADRSAARQTIQRTRHPAPAAIQHMRLDHRG